MKQAPHLQEFPKVLVNLDQTRLYGLDGTGVPSMREPISGRSRRKRISRRKE